VGHYVPLLEFNLMVPGISTVKMRISFIVAFHYLTALWDLVIFGFSHHEMHMPAPEFSADNDAWLTRMAAYLKCEDYSRDGREDVSMSRRFLIHLQKRGLTVHNVKPSDVAKYLRGVKRLRRSTRRANLSEVRHLDWRWRNCDRRQCLPAHWVR
jgi:hypothetical protein